MTAVETDRLDTPPRLIWRARLMAVCIGLMALAFSQHSGRVVADTKLDLTANPGGFLAQSLSLWDPSAAFGQLQNQAYGYLFPMGPFFWLADAANLDMWVTQRLWWTLLLVVAFLGMWRLSGALVIASPWARMAGSVIYALSPRILAELTITSAEVWPMAVAPWVLWPLVDRTPRTWLWRITRSALAVACLGGVNAVASGVALVLPALWFLTRKPALRTYGWGGAWLLAVLAAIMWWLGPLIVLGRHSPPFLDWIEGIAVTSSTASVFESVRGTSAWLGFLLTTNGPTWPGGFLFVSQPPLIAATALAAAAGLVGIGLPGRVREPAFLGVTVLVGLLLLTAGHQGATTSIVTQPVRELLDGSLAALRNLHKFDLVVRIPLALGMVAAIDAASGFVARMRLLPSLIPLSVGLGIVSVMAPGLMGQLARPEAYTAIPTYWHEAASWLDHQPGDGAVLMVPAAAFADFEWGSTKDNPLQALMTRPFVHRDGVPLGSGGATRFLDGLETELGSGQGGPHIREVLAAAGISYVLVPNDLRLDAAGNDLVRIHSALEKSGLPRVASFGHRASTIAESVDQTVDFRTILERPRLEVFSVGDTGATVRPRDSLAAVGSSGPENLVSLSRLLDDPYVLMHPNPGGPDSVGMDGLRRRETDFGSAASNRSHLFGPDETPRQDRRVWELTALPHHPQTVQGWDGLAHVSASSSASDAGATLRLGPGYGPAAALDGDDRTAWVSGRLGQASGEWLRLDFGQPTRIGTLRVQTYQDDRIGAPPATLSFRTENGVVREDVFPNGQVEARIPDGVTSWLSIRLDTVGEGTTNGFGIAEITLPDRLFGPRTVVPPMKDPGAILLSRELPGTPACVHLEEGARCNPEMERLAEERLSLRREVTVDRAGEYRARGWVTAGPGNGVDEFVDHPGGIAASASSRFADGVSVRPGAAFDGDLSTGWIAGRSDFAPQIDITLPERRVVSGLHFARSPSLGASRPKEVTVDFDDGTSVTKYVDDEGYAVFAERELRRMTVSFGETRPLVSISSRTGQRAFAPVGASEIRVIGAEDLNVRLPDSLPTGTRCGFGPAVFVNGKEYPTRVTGTLEDLRSGNRMRWEVCGDSLLSIDAGRNAIDLVASGQFVPESLVLSQHGVPKTSPATTLVALERDSAATLRMSGISSPVEQIIIVPQNFNRGWEAVDQNGGSLDPVLVNGWMQGWVLPAGTSEVTAHFSPALTYRLALGLGLGLMAALLGLSVVRAGARATPAKPISISRSQAIIVITSFAFLIGGWQLALYTGLIVGTTQVVQRRSRHPRRHQITLWAILVCFVMATALVILAPWPDGRVSLDSVLVQVLVFSGVALGTLAGFGGAVKTRRLGPSADSGPTA